MQRVIHRNLAYWQGKLARNNGHLPANMGLNLPNIIQAVEEGLLLPSAQLEAARLLRLMHRPAERLGWWEPWLELCQHTLPLCLPEEWPLWVRLRNGQGVMFRRCGRWREAVDLHQEAAELACRQGD